MSLQPDTPSSARFWNACLGDKSNFAVDRQLVEEMEAEYPGVRGLAHASRNFLHTAVRFLHERGVDQFIDLGAGMPITPNTHDIAQTLDPAARIVYVDNDPVVLTHARALLTGTPEGATDYLDLDFFHRDQVLEQAGRTLDLERPVGVLWLSTLGHVHPDRAPGLVRDYLSALPGGSYLALCDTLADETINRANQSYAASGTQPYTARTREDFAAITDGYEVVWPLQPLPDQHGDLTDQHGVIIHTGA